MLKEVKAFLSSGYMLHSHYASFKHLTCFMCNTDRHVENGLIWVSCNASFLNSAKYLVQ